MFDRSYASELLKIEKKILYSHFPINGSIFSDVCE